MSQSLTLCPLCPDGRALSVDYNGADYYYVYNLQGDVIALYNTAGNVVVEYTYDSWGRILSTTGSQANGIGLTNPFRYRGYLYDGETGLYYLRSRYYDPEVGRFLNADIFVSTGQGLNSLNMFAYCENNPVMYVDVTGTRHVKGIDACGDSYIVNPSNDYNNDYLLFSKKYTNRRDSGMSDLSDDEIMRKARDHTLTEKERRKYQEEKVRGLRNRQKRENFSILTEHADVLIGSAIILTASIGIAYVIANDATFIGTVDDVLLAPLIAWLSEGTKRLYL